jgi:hypothetical protein
MTKETDTPQPGCRYPEIEVQLSGNDGNAYAILGRVRRALIQHGVTKPEIDLFLEEARGGDYNQLIATCMSWVSVL